MLNEDLNNCNQVWFEVNQRIRSSQMGIRRVHHCLLRFVAYQLQYETLMHDLVSAWASQIKIPRLRAKMILQIQKRTHLHQPNKVHQWKQVTGLELLLLTMSLMNHLTKALWKSLRDDLIVRTPFPH